jgi:hypothetical protein
MVVDKQLATGASKSNGVGGRYMRTSFTKMIDNAIVGFGIERLNIREED